MKARDCAAQGLQASRWEDTSRLWDTHVRKMEQNKQYLYITDRVNFPCSEKSNLQNLSTWKENSHALQEVRR